MACGCAGSTPRQAAAQQQLTSRQVARQQRPVRTGGPGQPGYTWNGPQTRGATAK